MARLNNRQAKPGETKAAVAAHLTDASLAYFTEPGESFELAMERKKILQEVKIKQFTCAQQPKPKPGKNNSTLP